MTSAAATEQRLRDLARLRRVEDRIDREFAQPLDVEALARGAHLSAGHLSREFRAAYAGSPGDRGDVLLRGQAGDPTGPAP